MRAAYVSIFAALGLVLFKLLGGIFTNSLALYSEAGHSAVDLAAAVVTLLAVRWAGRPPDSDHHFGHSKYESLAALAQLGFLFAAGALIIREAVRRLQTDSPPEVYAGPALIVMLVSISVEGWRALSLMRAARRSGSEALAASSVHFLSDFLDSIAVIAGLTATYFGFAGGDSLAAILVALVILSLSVRLSRDVFYSLTDRAPAGLLGKVEKIVLSVKDVAGVHDIRVRQSGGQIFAEMHVHMDSSLPLDRAHDVLDRIESALHRHYPNMHIVTHPEPMTLPTGEVQ